MRRWWVSLVGFLLLSATVWCAESPKDIYFRGYDNFRAGATSERVKRMDAAMGYYLTARECFKRVLEESPTYSPAQVRHKLGEVDAKLRPILLAQGIAPETYLKPPRTTALPHVAQTPRVPLTPRVSLTPSVKTPVRPPVKQVTRQSYEQILAQTRAEIQERDLQKHRMKSDYEGKLREALSARPPALQPGELAKQVRANETLKQDYDYLKTQSRKGESALLEAIQELDRLQKANAYLHQRLAEAGSPTQMKLIRTENASLRKQIEGLRRVVDGRAGMGTLQTQLAKERQRARELEAENLKLRQILTTPQRP